VAFRDGRRGGVYGGARLVTMGGGEHGFRGLRERAYGGWLGAFGSTKDTVSSPIPNSL
jgi:hypothetical protein